MIQSHEVEACMYAIYILIRNFIRKLLFEIPLNLEQSYYYPKLYIEALVFPKCHSDLSWETNFLFLFYAYVFKFIINPLSIFRAMNIMNNTSILINDHREPQANASEPFQLAHYSARCKCGNELLQIFELWILFLEVNIPPLF